MGLDCFTAALPVPIRRSHVIVDEPDDDALAELHARVDDLSERVLVACNDAIAGEGDEADEEAEAAREILHDGIDTVLFGNVPVRRLYLDHRTWYVTGGLSFGDLPYGFEAAAALALSGITDQPLGLTARQAARWTKERRKIHLGVGRTLLALLRSCLEEELVASGVPRDEVTAVLRRVDAQVKGRDDDLVELVGLVLRGGRADWLA